MIQVNSGALGTAKELYGKIVNVSGSAGATTVSLSPGGTLNLQTGKYTNVFLYGAVNGNRTIASGVEITNYFWGTDKSISGTPPHPALGNGTFTLTNTNEAGKISNVYIGGSGSGRNVSGTVDFALVGKTIENNVYLGGTNSATVTGTVNYNMNSGTVKGSIYGGSDSSGGNVGTANITLASGGTVAGNVFGGGLTAKVTTANITMNSDIVGDTIYGGGASSGNVGTATIDLNNNRASGKLVFGGGTGGTVDNAIVNINTGANNYLGKVYGGPNGTGATVTDAMVTVYTPDMNANVYGGGLKGKTVDAKLTVDGTGVVSATVFGGGETQDTTTSTTTVLIEGSVKDGVYGGGQNSQIDNGSNTAQTKVTINGGSVTAGHIFGGGIGILATPAHVKGSTHVIFTNGTLAVTKNIYGGSEDFGEVSVEAKVEINGALSAADPGNIVYGGGYKGGDNTKVQKTDVYIKANTAEDVYGGGYKSSTVNANITVDNGAIVSKNVYGSGHRDSSGDGSTTNTIVNIVTGSITQNVYGGSDMPVSGVAVVNASGGTINGETFGGGSTAPVTTSVVNISGGSVEKKEIFGGGEGGAATVTTAYVNVSGGTAEMNVYGGGKTATNTVTSSIVTISGGKIDADVYGGGLLGKVTNARVILSDGAGGADFTGPGTVFGGGKSVATGNTLVQIIGTSAVDPAVIYGGGDAQPVDTESKVEFYNGTIGCNIYGGGLGAGATVPKSGVYFNLGTKYTEPATYSAPSTPGAVNAGLGGNAPILDSNGYGGGHNGAISNNSFAYMEVGTANDNIYGGGHDAMIGTGSTTSVISSAEVKNSGTLVKGSVFGGGHDTDAAAPFSHVNGSTKVIISDSAIVEDDVYGGGNLPGADVKSSTEVILRTGFTVGKTGTPANVYGGGFNTNVDKTTKVLAQAGRITGNVYGGSWGTSGTPVKINVIGNTSDVTEVIIDNGDLVEGSVYGGGRDYNTTHGNVKVSVINGGKVNVDVYGGGINNSPVNGNTTVSIAGEVIRDVYGAGTEDSLLTGNTSVTVETTGKVKQDVYGGGWGVGNSGVGTDSHITGKTVVDIKGEVTRNVFGGGREESDIQGADGAKVTVYNNATVGNNVFGGGTDTSMIDEHTEVIISGAVKNNVYGGGWIDSDVKGVKGATVTVTSTGVVGKTDDGNITVKEGDVYGGGLDNSHIFHGTVVKVLGSGLNGGKVYGNVYGGGSGYGTNNASHINGANGEGTEVTISGYVGKNVFGGGLTNSEIKGTNGTKVIIEATAKIGHLKSFVVRDYYSEYKSTGNVYGGGEGNSDVVNTVDGIGTNVLIKKGAEVYGSVFGGGLDQSDIVVGGGTSATRVTVYGHVDNALGGGRDSNVHQTALGSIVVVAGDGAIVQHDVYGGGWSSASGISALSLRSNINVVSGANVRERIFGGGRGANGSTGDAAMSDTAKIYVGPTDKNGASGLGEGVLNSGGKMTVIGYRGVIEGETTSTFVTNVTGNKPSNAVAPYADFYLRQSEGFAKLGSIYGGGNQSYVAKDIDIVIDDTKQMAFNRISGGSVSLADYTGLIVGQNRNIVINNFGSGDMTDTTFDQYTPLDKFVAIRFLQDFTKLDANDSFLTVYYNLDAFDNVGEHLRVILNNGSNVFGTDYVHDQGSKLTMNSGIYNPWRPEDHTVVNVDSEIHVVNGAKFRVRGGYSIHLNKGIFMHDIVPKNRISLMIDLLLDEGTQSTIATTTQVYSVPDNVKIDNVFRYDELPKTLFPRNIKDDLSADILGVNFYIPPTEIRDTDGNTTDNGGTNNPDKGAGSSNGGTNSSGGGSSSGGGGGGGGAAGGGGLSSGASTSTASSQYTTSPTTAVKTEDAVKAVNAAIKAAGAGKTGSVVEKKAGQISGDTLRAMSTAATKAGGSVMYYADTVRADNSIEGRMYINPSKAAGVQGVIQTGVYTSASKVSAVTKMFNKYFSNKIVVIHLDQAGSFGMEVEIAAKVDLKDLNTKSLQFYSYSLTSNSYVAIQNPKYFIDSSGYLHFNTTVGGEIIVTDQPLQRK
ncbi:MAG: beta strand repeat-containing protein [Oscillospiraceae bacterium]